MQQPEIKEIQKIGVETIQIDEPTLSSFIDPIEIKNFSNPKKDIDFLIDKGASVVWNVYGSTEFPPPIFLGESTASFNIPRFCKFADDGELYMGSTPTGDVFDLKTKTFSHRKKEEIGVTWKS